jgi:hypothetical protein
MPDPHADNAPQRFELADFDPADGHLHTCSGVGMNGGWRRQPNGPCPCAALLYCVAQDAVAAVREVAQWSSETWSSRGGHSMASEPAHNAPSARRVR